MAKMTNRFWYAGAIAFATLTLAGCGNHWPMEFRTPPAIQHQRDLEPATEWDRTLILTVRDVHFDSRASSVRWEDRAAIEQAGLVFNRMLEEEPDLVIVIEGHSDDAGSRQFNHLLGKRRAEAVREVLVGAGVPVAHLRTASLGNRDLLCRTTEDACREKNRRVHFRSARFIGDRR